MFHFLRNKVCFGLIVGIFFFKLSRNLFKSMSFLMFRNMFRFARTFTVFNILGLNFVYSYYWRNVWGCIWREFAVRFNITAITLTAFWIFWKNTISTITLTILYKSVSNLGHNSIIILQSFRLNLTQIHLLSL